MMRMLVTAGALGFLATPAFAGGSQDDEYECKLPEKYLCGEHRGGDRDRGERKGRERVAVCHDGRTIWVARPALQAHRRHGDTPGACADDARRRPARS